MKNPSQNKRRIEPAYKKVPKSSSSFNVVKILWIYITAIFNLKNFGKNTKNKQIIDAVIFTVGIITFGKGIIVALNDSWFKLI